MTILQQAQAQLEEITAIRRHLHRNPEIGFEEVETTALIKRELEKISVEIKNVLRRPIKSERTPPTKPPEVMPMKYQNCTVAIFSMVSPQDLRRAGAMKPKFQLSICSQK